MSILRIGKRVIFVTSLFKIFSFGILIQRLSKALINNLKDDKTVSDSEINIFQAHLMILQDQTFLEDIINLIRTKNRRAEICLSEYIEDMAQKFKNMDDPYFKDRAYDFIDIGQRIIMIM